MAPRKHNFTLVEIMVVVAIMVLVTSLAVVRVRDSSATVRFDAALREFRQFALKARVRANDLGVDQVLVFLPEERRFRIVAPPAPTGEDEGETSYYSLAAPEELMQRYRRREYADAALAARGGELPELAWSLPETFEVSDAETMAFQAGVSGEIEVFRFLGAGGGMGGGQFLLRLGERLVSVAFSPVTGLMTVTEAE